MKSHTDLGQSKKLAEFLPLESADLCHKCIGDESYDVIMRPYSEYYEKYKLLVISKDFNAIPCWSLAALLDVLPDSTDIVKNKADTENEKYMCTVGVKHDIISTFGNNPVDACYGMIINLHKLSLI